MILKQVSKEAYLSASNDHEMVVIGIENFIYQPLDAIKILSFDLEREALSRSRLLKDINNIIVRLRHTNGCPWEPANDEQDIGVGKLYSKLLSKFIVESEHKIYLNITSFYPRVFDAERRTFVRGTPTNKITEDFFKQNQIDRYHLVKVKDEDIADGFINYLIFECSKHNFEDVLSWNWDRGVECYVFRADAEYALDELLSEIPATDKALRKLVDSTILSFEVTSENEAIRILTKQFSIKDLLNAVEKNKDIKIALEALANLRGD